MLHRIPHLLRRIPYPILAIISHQLRQLRVGLLLVCGHIPGNEPPLHTSQVGNVVHGKTPRDKASSGVAAGEDGVHASGTVDARVGGDVVDGTVESEIDGTRGVFAVIAKELRIGEMDGAALE